MSGVSNVYLLTYGLGRGAEPTGIASSPASGNYIGNTSIDFNAGISPRKLVGKTDVV
jgi:hypothetical protein